MEKEYGEEIEIDLKDILYLLLDKLCKKLENSEEVMPILLKIRFFKIRILPLA